MLGVDAAWTAHNPSGVALLEVENGQLRLLAVAGSYTEFTSRAIGEQVGSGPVDHSPNVGAMLAACKALGGREPDVVAVDMPLSRVEITGRRSAEAAVQRAYGGRWCSVHTPSRERPGPISDRLREAFQARGYGLATLEVSTPCIMEVYPHPALLELARADVRLPYKLSRIRRYWPAATPQARRAKLFDVWSHIVDLLDGVIVGAARQLPLPAAEGGIGALKAFEDQLDAVVCAWVGARALAGLARPFGCEANAVWIPLPEVA